MSMTQISISIRFIGFSSRASQGQIGVNTEFLPFILYFPFLPRYLAFLFSFTADCIGVYKMSVLNPSLSGTFIQIETKGISLASTNIVE